MLLTHDNIRKQITQVISDEVCVKSQCNCYKRYTHSVELRHSHHREAFSIIQATLEQQITTSYGKNGRDYIRIN